MADPANIFISVAEASADLHAARLVEFARQHHPNWSFCGLTGPRLRAAGVKTVFDFTQHAAMITDILKVLGPARAALRAAEAAWCANRPDLVIVMDSSALHLRMAKCAKRIGLPVLYYIAPQIWASRPWRIAQLRKYADRVACILPFEQDYFTERGVAAEFVGHPLFESLAAETPDDDHVAQWRAAGDPVVAILPGSRQHVIERMLPRQLDVVRRLAAERPITTLISCADAERGMLVERCVTESGVVAKVVVADNASLLTAADLVLVSSGTATLHVAHYRKPMIIMYDAGGGIYWPYRLLGPLLINLPHLSLVNILGRRRVVPEFMPFVRDTAPIAAVARQLLSDDEWRAATIADLDRVVRPLRDSRASEAVCRVIAALLARGHAPPSGECPAACR